MEVCSWRVMVLLAIFFSIVALLFTVLGFGTNHWINFEVDRSQLTDEERFVSVINENVGRFYFTRHRGIFLECFPDLDAAFITNNDEVVDGDCFELDLGISDLLSLSSDFTIRTVLHRCALAFLAVGIATALVTVVAGIVSAVKQWSRCAYFASGFAFATGIFVTLGTAFYLGMEFTEREAEGDDGELYFRKRWTQELQNATTTSFSWSFILCWIAVAMAFASAILFIFVGRKDTNASEVSSMSYQSELGRKVLVPFREPSYYDNEANFGRNPVFWPYESHGRKQKLALYLPSSEHSGSIQSLASNPQPLYYGNRPYPMRGVSYVHYPNNRRQERHTQWH